MEFILGSRTERMWSWPADNDRTFPVDRALFYILRYTRYLNPGHLNINLLNIAISHSLHLQSLHHNPHYHQHQHQGDLMLRWSLNFFSDVNRDLLRSFIVNKECRFLCLPTDVQWGSFVTHSFLPHGPWGRNECLTNEPQRTSAGRLLRHVQHKADTTVETKDF